MENQETVYHNPARKREIIELLKQQHQFSLQASRELDEKAWEILRATTSTLGIISGLLITFIANQASTLFWVGMVCILIVYLLHIRQIILAISPRNWAHVPGGMKDDQISFESLLDKYFLKNPSEDDYLNQLIGDFAGSEEGVGGDGKFINGAIQKVDTNNRVKNEHITSALWLMAIAITGLLFLGASVIVVQ